MSEFGAPVALMTVGASGIGLAAARPLSGGDATTAVRDAAPGTMLDGLRSPPSDNVRPPQGLVGDA
jgi:NAD(P)-dependent dehydrogenase (short-subunit alcohol dehydrogenase family)